MKLKITNVTVRGSLGGGVAMGPAGSAVLNGTVDPTPLVGNNGDFYINTATSMLFGPKTAGAWGAGVSIEGPEGPAGKSVLNGTVNPTPMVGVDGDFYINTDTSTLFGPKAGGAWPAGVSLIGPTGEDGNTILNGIADPGAGIGENGDFYINTATNTLFGPKAAGAWPAGVSLVGPVGNNGDDGQDGQDGADGRTVLSGTVNPGAGAGVDGDFYINTATNTLFGPKAAGAWPSGVSLVGPVGNNGNDGQDGADGRTVLSGTVNPGAGVGVDGDFYINTATNTLFGPKASGAWPAGVSLVGPQGAQGPQGNVYFSGLYPQEVAYLWDYHNTAPLPPFVNGQSGTGAGSIAVTVTPPLTGAATYRTGTTATGRAQTSTLGVFRAFAGQTVRLKARIRLVNQTPNSTDTFFVAFGFVSDLLTATPPHCAAFYLTVGATTTTLVAQSRNGGAIETTNIATIPASTDYTTFEVVMNGATNVQFFISGVLVATHTTMPSAASTLAAFGITKQLGTSLREVYITTLAYKQEVIL